ncbi:unnamed protein product [Cylindrotheca closterium]|uniref:Uncharacterized protein n=1 Tax=Cylindrotheca closterium TaxID=2856 RepID=A0AAD2CNT0_9STRA|nr:unnamed protein product [Cylindrotheca closterium]
MDHSKKQKKNKTKAVQEEVQEEVQGRVQCASVMDQLHEEMTQYNNQQGRSRSDSINVTLQNPAERLAIQPE